MKKNKFFTFALAAFTISSLVFAGCNKKESSKGVNLEKLKASAPASESDFKFKLTEDSSGVIITGYKGDKAKAKPLVIPASIQGMSVKEIGERAFHDGSYISALVIPEGVEFIGEWAFESQGNLVAVALPSSLIRIGEQAFKNDKKLTTVNFPENLKVIDRSAFSYTGLNSIDLPEGLLVIGNGAFSDSAITSVTLPKSLKILRTYAFGHCDNLSEINIPDGLTVVDAELRSAKSYSSEIEIPFDDYPEITFDKIFTGTKISESIELQKKLKEYKTVALRVRFGEHMTVSKWDW